MIGLNIKDIRKFETLVQNASKIVIVTHMKPDGDAMGSSAAMYGFLKSLDKENVRIVISDPYPDYLGFIISKEAGRNIFTYEDMPSESVAAINESDLVICLDFNAFHRTDRLEQALEESGATKVLIDHHLSPDTDKFSLVFSETEISSASELLYQILIRTSVIDGKPERLPKESATALMAGMTTDTNNFANSTYPSTLKMASDLLSAGVDRDMIIYELYNKQRENRIRLMGHALKDLLTITDDGVAYMVIDSDTLKRYDIKEGETEGFVNMPLTIGKVKMSLLLKEDGDKVRVSIRSKKGTSANRCARLYFNGGGHENAAGGKLYIPENIKDISEAGNYIELYTHKFLTEDK